LEQTPLDVPQVVVHLLDVLQQQQAQIKALEARIKVLEARLQQNSGNSDRLPSSDPPYAKTARAGVQGRLGAKAGHPGHRQALVAPMEVIEVTPETCACGQQKFPATMPYYTHQRIELPDRLRRSLEGHWETSGLSVQPRPGD
jgi:transposase